jgi:hypothetical protein
MQCARCGASNPADYRFCGSCGNVLQRRPVTIADEKRVYSHQSAPVSGPSFLGLSGTPDEDQLSYLLEDDEPPRHRGASILTLLLLVFLLTAGGYAAYWKYYFVPRHAGGAPTPEVPAFAYEHTPAAAHDLSVDSNQLPSPALANQFAIQNAPAALKTSESQPAAANIRSPRPAAKSPESKADAQGDTEDAPPESAQLVAAGEKYLYGRGVPSNCRQAVKNFEDAADLDDAKAMARLGSMYASGRCVEFNRVKAYQWFAKAKNADPNETWAEASMDMLWRTMSRKERAAVLK